MAFFAVLTLVPSTIAVGSAIGLSKEVLGGSAAREAENAFVDAVSTLMGPQLADTVIAPFVHAQLQQANGGVALGGLLIAWWLSSHLFESTGHALDAIYEVEDSRTTLAERMLALAFALVSVVLVAATVEMMILGPLGDPHAGLSKWLGLGEVYGFVWSVIRWPLLLAVVVTFLGCLYRFTPNVRHDWRENLPGAIVGATLWILAAAVFRLTAPLSVRPTIASEDPTVVVISQSVNAVVATVLWAYLASAAILLGGEVNALHAPAPGGAGGRAARPSLGRPPAPDVEGWPVGTIDHLVLDRETATTAGWPCRRASSARGSPCARSPTPGRARRAGSASRTSRTRCWRRRAPSRTARRRRPRPASSRSTTPAAAWSAAARGRRPASTRPWRTPRTATAARWARTPTTGAHRSAATARRVAPDAAGWAAPATGAPNGHAPAPDGCGTPAAPPSPARARRAAPQLGQRRRRADRLAAADGPQRTGQPPNALVEEVLVDEGEGEPQARARGALDLRRAARAGSSRPRAAPPRRARARRPRGAASPTRAGRRRARSRSPRRPGGGPARRAARPGAGGSAGSTRSRCRA